MAEALQDMFDNEGGVAGPPVVSWNYAQPGKESAHFRGIVFAPDVDLPHKGYRVEQQIGQNPGRKDTDDPRLPLFWPPRDNSRGVKQPVSKSLYLELGGIDGQEVQVPQHEMFLTTDYRDGAFMSDNAQAKAKDAKREDVGDRRLLIDGLDFKPKSLAALKAIGAKSPQPGQVWDVWLTEREPGKIAGRTTKRHKVEITAPTPETLKIAKEAAARYADAIASQTNGDAFAGAGEDEEPPF